MANDTGEKALQIWVGYVARTFQNILIAKIPNDLLKATEHSYDDWGARRILGHFREDFVAALDRKDYCSGTFDRELMEIYRLSIQESEDELSLLLNGKRLDIFSAFIDRSIHAPARSVAGYDRLMRCFETIYGLRAMKYQRAMVHDLLGRYKAWYAIYVSTRESAYYPERWPAQLCRDAVEHFNLALSLLPELRSPGEKKERLVRILSMRDPYPAERLRRRLVAQKDTIREGGSCSL